MGRLLALGMVGVLAAACTGAAVVDHPRPEQSTRTTGSSGGRQLGDVAGPVCDVTTAEANLGLGGAAADRVYVFSRPTSGACRRSRASVAVAADGGPVQAVSSRAVRCHARCRVIATPDVDRDGAAEIAVGQRGFAAFFSLFIVQPAPTPTVSPLHTRGGRIVGFAVGGTMQSMWGLICAGPTLTSWGAAETAEGNGPYSVNVATYRMRGAELMRLSGHHSSVPQGKPSLLPENGGVALGASRGLCGTPFLPGL